MAAMYGNKFLDAWRGIDIQDVKKCWADELRVYSVDHVGEAISALKSHNFPPTLPEFLQLCDQARKDKPREYTPHNRSSLPSLEVCSSPEALAAKERCMETVRRLGASLDNPIGGTASTAWAERIMERFANREHIPADSLRMARAALAAQGIR